MRVTKNQLPLRKCAFCGEPLVPGTLGANALVTTTMIRRGHVACVRAWRDDRLADQRRAGLTEDKKTA